MFMKFFILEDLGRFYYFANLSSQYYIKRVLRLFGQLVSLLFNPIEKVEGKGSAYTMVFRKGV